MPQSRPRRLLRISKACKDSRFMFSTAANIALGDFCHKRRIKCQNSPVDPGRCQNCTEFDVRCTYSRPSRRGTGSSHAAVAAHPPPQHADPEPARPGHPTRTTPSQAPSVSQEPWVDRGRFGQGDENSSGAERGCSEPLSPAWRDFARFATPILRRLLAVYHETVYPM